MILGFVVPFGVWLGFGKVLYRCVVPFVSSLEVSVGGVWCSVVEWSRECMHVIA